MNKLNKNSGFTLIELMVVFVVMGILATIALPTYQDFSSKAQIQSAYLEVSSLKKTLYLSILRGYAVNDASDLGWVSGGSKVITSDPTISIDSSTGESYIEVVLDGNIQPIAKGTKIKLIHSADGVWSCEITKSASLAWKKNLAPKACIVKT